VNRLRGFLRILVICYLILLKALNELFNTSGDHHKIIASIAASALVDWVCVVAILCEKVVAN